jgi:DGQHR domain-containing protein
MVARPTLLLPALEIRQGQRRRIYSFAVDGKRLLEFATVSRIRRADAESILGYQRPEVQSHINEIKAYLESDAPMVPNSIVLAFDKRVRFQPVEAGTGESQDVRFGHLVIPITSSPDHEKAAWIVDGQQRVAAVSRSRLKRFTLSAVGFIADSDAEQREQFILVNSTKPLPKGLIYELIPHTQARLPSLLERRKFPAYLLQRLSQDEDSPFRGLIQTPTNPEGVVKDNSVLRMLENSLADGALYRFREPGTDESDAEKMLRVLKSFWAAVGNVFESAWGQPPKKSRLMHGAGITSLGFLMDAIADRLRGTLLPKTKDFEADLEPMTSVCSWTAGYWNFGPGSQVRWNEIQNTSKDIQLLTNYLLHQYKARVWSTKN